MMIRRSVAVLGAAALWLTMAMTLAPASLADDPFRSLAEVLPTPSSMRLATGAPGPDYWQQRADYQISVTLDEENHRITGTQTVTYHNNSPEPLTHLWLHLDMSRYTPDSDGTLSATHDGRATMEYRALRAAIERREFDGGMKVTRVVDGRGRALDHQIIGTMLRIELPEPLRPGQRFRFSTDWHYTVHDQKVFWGRVGYEMWDDGNAVYSIAKFHPRMAAYTDYGGWHNTQFLGLGEFTLEFGDFEVEITVPADHIVAATGELRNPRQVLSAEQRRRLDEARDARTPVFIVTPEEAAENERERATGTRTWRFRAENVRDFAFASSRKFVWDAMGHHQEGRRQPVMAMSFYPREGMPLWDRYSTQAVVHAMEVYSEFTFPYPYPTAQSVLTGIGGGMEFPMITFNGPRPEIDKETGEATYGERVKYALIGVIIHEIGHQYFPMIVNSDERQWFWMDEGLNTFLQFQAEQRWQEKYPSWRGEPRDMVGYMVSAQRQPVMIRADSIIESGNNAYGVPATALVVLRESILGRERFDRAFREYANRWMFKRVTPADFFRTMEDVAGTNLDWFWRGWFYSTDHMEYAITNVRKLTPTTKDPEQEAAWRRARDEAEPVSLTWRRNRAEGILTRVERFPELADIYNEHDAYFVTEKEKRDFQQMLEKLEDWQRELLARGGVFYITEIENRGGLVGPVVLRYDYEDGSHEIVRHPAEIWRRTPKAINIFHVADREVARVTIDPDWEFPMANRAVTRFPRLIEEERLDLTEPEKRRNLMRELLEEARRAEKEEAENAEGDPSAE
jgi:hypothetical protein